MNTYHVVISNWFSFIWIFTRKLIGKKKINGIKKSGKLVCFLSKGKSFSRVMEIVFTSLVKPGNIK